jgi:hypothetical protein
VKRSVDGTQRTASGERGQHRGSAVSSPYLHGGPNRVEPQGLIHQDAMPQSYGRLKHNFFTTSREVAEDAADMRDGLGHGWIHAVEPTGDFEVDRGEPESWRSRAPLRVLSVEPGRLNGKTPHPPILRQQKTAATGGSAAQVTGHLETSRAPLYPAGDKAGALSSPAQLAATGFPDSQDQRGMLSGIRSSSAKSACSTARRSPSYRTRGRRR